MSSAFSMLFVLDFFQASTLWRSLGALWTLGLLLFALPLSYHYGRLLTGPGAGRASRLLAAAVVLAASAIALFHPLIWLGIFFPIPALGAASLTIFAAWKYSPAPFSYSDSLRRLWNDSTFWILRADYEGFRGITSVGAVFVIIGFALVLIRFGRFLVAPPMVWDDLTYHLVKTARWIQDGAWLSYPAPDSWVYYEFFPAFGSMIYAWFAVGTGDLTLWILPVVGAWLLLMIAVAAWARIFGAPRVLALAAALALGFNPMPLHAMASGHVDLESAAWVTGGIVFLTLFWLRLIHRRRYYEKPLAYSGPVILAALALALAIGTKQSHLPMAILGLGALGLGLVYRGRQIAPRELQRLALGAMLAMALGSIPYARAWILTGNPTHPFPSPLGEGSRQLIKVMDGSYLRIDDELRRWSPLVLETFIISLFSDIRPLTTSAFQRDSINFGWGGGVLVIMGFFALFGVLRAPGLKRSHQRTRTIISLLWILLVCAAVIISISSPVGTTQRTVWQEFAGRFVLLAVLALTVLATSLGETRTARGLFATSLGFSFLFGLPFGLQWEAEFFYYSLGALLLLALFGLLYAAAALISRWQSGRLPLGKLGFLLPIVLGLGAVSAVISSARVASRPDYHEWMATGRSYTLHVLAGMQRDEARIWTTTDRLRPTTIAMSAGFGYVGLNWYRLPYMGPRFENRVVYVSPWPNNELVDGDLITSHVMAGNRPDYQLFVQRLRDAEVNHVVAVAPRHFVLDWMEQNPGDFAFVDGATSSVTTLFRLRPPNPAPATIPRP